MISDTNPSPLPHSVAVVGAAGHTGRFVIAELLRRGIQPIAIGRDEGKMLAAGFTGTDFPVRSASLDDADALDRVLGDADAVINCAGPFLDSANAVAMAALRGRIHYLDVTAEQASAQAVLDEFSDAARKAGLVFLPAMGFYGGFADLLATAAMGDWAAADEVRVGIALSFWHPTQGTRLTGQRNTVPRVVLRDGKIAPMGQAGVPAAWDFPEPFGRQEMTEVPLSEVILIARHLKIAALYTYLNDTPLRDLRDAATPPPLAVDDRGRSAQTFVVKARAVNGTKVRRVIAQGQDIYAFTAPLVVEAAVRILRGNVRSHGALAPGEAFDANDFLEALAPEHLRLDVDAA